MELSSEQKEALEKQKEQCPFCKIIKGDIPSKKVFEDEKTIAVLDINPAGKGHTLVMPKEHYPIMALIPPDEFNSFFETVKELSTAIQDALVSEGTTIFIANGWAAGQQSQHFMMHIIPRDSGDGLTNFDVPKNEADASDIKDGLKNNLNIMIGKRSPGKAQSSIPNSGAQKQLSIDQLIQVLDANPQIKTLLIEDQELFKKTYSENPQLRKIFTGFDIDEVIKEIWKREGKEPPISEKTIEEEKELPVQQEKEKKAPSETFTEEPEQSKSQKKPEKKEVEKEEIEPDNSEEKKVEEEKENDEDKKHTDLDDIAALFK